MITNITFDINEFIKDNYKIFKIDSKISKSIPDERQIMKIISSTKKRKNKNKNKNDNNCEKNEKNNRKNEYDNEYGEDFGINNIFFLKKKYY